MQERLIIKISIIIPIYNAESYLEQCIKSVFGQTLKELEILCVDDGSTDGSMQILRKMQNIDARIVIYQQENLGAGEARNLALKKAKGKYVAFLDADDFYMDNDALELMYEACEEKKVSVCASARRHVKNQVIGTESTIKVFGENEIGCLLYYEKFQIDYYFQSYLIARELFVEHNIFFPRYRMYEDPPFLANVFFTARQFVVVDTCLYCYRAADERAKFNRKKTEDLLRGIIDNLIFAKQNNLDILFHNTAERLEKDFAMIIYENMSLESFDILKLLLESSRIIGEKNCRPGFLVKPLRLLLFNNRKYEKDILNFIEMKQGIAIYGAGKYGHIFLAFLKRNNLIHKVKYVIVSNLSGNASQIKGIPIITLDEFLNRKSRQTIIITANEQNSRMIAELLNQNNYTDCRVLNEIFWELLLQDS